MRASTVVAVAAIFWGLWWLPLRGLERAGLDPLAANLWIYLIVGLAVSPVLWARRYRIAVGGPGLWGAAMLFGAAILAWNLALLTGEIVRVTLLFYLAPIWGTALGWAFLGERIGVRRLLALPLGLGGAVVLLGGEGLPVPAGLGDWLGLASGVLFAAAATLARRFAVDGVSYTALAFLASAILAVALTAGSGAPTAWPGAEAVVLAAATGLFWLLPVTFGLLWGSTRIDPGRLGLLMLLEVIAAAVSAALLTDEPFGLREAVGCALILSAGLAEISGGRRR